jgi:hypothetical protein
VADGGTGSAGDECVRLVRDIGSRAAAAASAAAAAAARFGSVMPASASDADVAETAGVEGRPEPDAEPDPGMGPERHAVPARLRDGALRPSVSGTGVVM